MEVDGAVHTGVYGCTDALAHDGAAHRVGARNITKHSGLGWQLHRRQPVVRPLVVDGVPVLLRRVMRRQVVLERVFVRVNRLLVLAEVVEAREGFGAVGARKGALARVFAPVAGQVLGPGERLVTVGEPRALEHSALQHLVGSFLGHGADARADGAGGLRCRISGARVTWSVKPGSLGQ